MAPQIADQSHNIFTEELYIQGTCIALIYYAYTYLTSTYS